jgi:hypothetical protein
MKCKTLLLTVFSVFLAAGAFAQQIQRLSAQFKNFDGTETSTTVGACGPTTLVLPPGCAAIPPPGSGGTLVYTKAVVVPTLSGGQTMYITISAVGDNHFGESNFLSCNVDGRGGVGSATTVCNPTPTIRGVDLAPGGWVGMTHHFKYDNVTGGACNATPGCVVTYTSNGMSGQVGGDGGGGQGDEHDNDYYYTWCKPISPGSHVVNLRLGNFTGNGNNTVFFEKAFIFIDVSNAPPFGNCTKSSL